MPHYLNGALFLALMIPLVTGLAMISSSFAVAKQRARGRDAVEAKLASLGETPISIESVPVAGLMTRTGLSAPASAFRIVTLSTNGRRTTPEWVYEAPLITARRPAALKRLAHGIW